MLTGMDLKLLKVSIAIPLLGLMYSSMKGGNPDICSFSNVHLLLCRGAKWFVGHQQMPSWELCNFSIGMGFCFYPMTLLSHGNEVTGCWKIVQFPTLPFSSDFDSGNGINLHNDYAIKAF